MKFSNWNGQSGALRKCQDVRRSGHMEIHEDDVYIVALSQYCDCLIRRSGQEQLKASITETVYSGHPDEGIDFNNEDPALPSAFDLG